MRLLGVIHSVEQFGSDTRMYLTTDTVILITSGYPRQYRDRKGNERRGAAESEDSSKSARLHFSI